MKTLLASITLSVCLTSGLVLDCPTYDVGLRGNDLDNPPWPTPSSWEECGELCLLRPECLFWSYNETGNHHCYLKYSDEGYHTVKGIVSGEVGCTGGEFTVPVEDTTTTTSLDPGVVSLTYQEVSRRMDIYTMTKYQSGGFGAPGFYYSVIEDPSSGTYSYQYDCSGFVWHVLNTSSPLAYEDARIEMNLPESGYCPALDRWNNFMQKVADEGTFGAWQAVYEVTDLKPGDIIVKDIHVMIAMDNPESTDDQGIFSLKIADSTNDVHHICSGDGDDTRVTNSEKGTTGMGTGYIRVESGMWMGWCMCCGEQDRRSIMAARPMA